MTTVAYLRVSTAHQLDGGGLDRQEKCVIAWAKANRERVPVIYIEPGVSGTLGIEDRTALPELLDALERDEGITHVLVENMDRLARDGLVAELIFSEFEKVRPGVKVISCDTGLDLADVSDPSRKMIRQILGAVAEFNKQQTVMRLRAGRERQRRENGRCEGRKPLEVDPLHLTAMVDARSRGMTMRMIAVTLRGLKYFRPTGAQYSHQAISEILRRYGEDSSAGAASGSGSGSGS